MIEYILAATMTIIAGFLTLMLIIVFVCLIRCMNDSRKQPQKGCCLNHSAWLMSHLRSDGITTTFTEDHSR